MRIAACHLSKEKRVFPYRHPVAIELLVLVRRATVQPSFAQLDLPTRNPAADASAKPNGKRGFASSETGSSLDCTRKENLQITNKWAENEPPTARERRRNTCADFCALLE